MDKLQKYDEIEEYFPEQPEKCDYVRKVTKARLLSSQSSSYMKQFNDFGDDQHYGEEGQILDVFVYEKVDSKGQKEGKIIESGDWMDR